MFHSIEYTFAQICKNTEKSDFHLSLILSCVVGAMWKKMNGLTLVGLTLTESIIVVIIIHN